MKERVKKNGKSLFQEKWLNKIVHINIKIDTFVYKLYELSYEEVLLIEPDFGQRVSVEQYEKVEIE